MKNKYENIGSFTLGNKEVTAFHVICEESEEEKQAKKEREEKIGSHLDRVNDLLDKMLSTVEKNK